MKKSSAEQRATRENRWAAEYRAAARAFAASGMDMDAESLQDFIAGRFSDTPEYRRAKKDADSAAVEEFWRHVFKGVSTALAQLGIEISE
jgi:hypothetical protein